jgi:hypothetical protein
VNDGQQTLTELDDRWILPFRGLVVTQIQVDFAFGLTLENRGAVRIESTAVLSWAAAGANPEKIVLEPSRQEIAAGLALFNTTVLSAVAFKPGGLQIAFSNGRLLRVDPDPNYEAWTANGPGGMLFVAMPGGDLAIWSARPAEPH